MSVILLRDSPSELMVRDYSGSVLLGHPAINLTVTSRSILQDPVDCVMAGNQREFKQARAGGRVLKRIFGE